VRGERRGAFNRLKRVDRRELQNPGDALLRTLCSNPRRSINDRGGKKEKPPLRANRAIRKISV
jgi:hypothetical protein